MSYLCTTDFEALGVSSEALGGTLLYVNLSFHVSLHKCIFAGLAAQICLPSNSDMDALLHIAVSRRADDYEGVEILSMTVAYFLCQSFYHSVANL